MPRTSNPLIVGAIPIRAIFGGVGEEDDVVFGWMLKTQFVSRTVVPLAPRPRLGCGSIQVRVLSLPYRFGVSLMASSRAHNPCYVGSSPTPESSRDKDIKLVQLRRKTLNPWETARSRENLVARGERLLRSILDDLREGGMNTIRDISFLREPTRCRKHKGLDDG